MTSEKQMLANRKNSVNAGVKTEEGKIRVRFNALKHGLTSKSLISLKGVFSESLNDYQEILQGLRETFQPSSFGDEMLVEQMARALFKMARCEVLEVTAFDAKYDFDFSGRELCLSEQKISLVQRYRAQLENQFFRARAALLEKGAPQQLDLFSQMEAARNGGENESA